MFPQRDSSTTSKPRRADHPPVPGESSAAAPAPVIRTTVAARGEDVPPAEVTTTPEGIVQAVEGLARCLERVIEALSPESERALEAAADELRKAKIALGLTPSQGEMSKAGRDAHAAQRADPAHSPHFGG